MVPVHAVNNNVLGIILARHNYDGIYSSSLYIVMGCGLPFLAASRTVLIFRSSLGSASTSRATASGYNKICLITPRLPSLSLSYPPPSLPPSFPLSPSLHLIPIPLRLNLTARSNALSPSLLMMSIPALC